MTPEAVVQRQLDAYNARDLETLVSIYAENAQLFEHPDKLIAEGRVALRARFAARFSEPNLRAKLLHRAVLGNRVIDHEEVTRTFSEGTGTLPLVMIYEVEDGLITKAWSIAGPRVIDGECHPLNQG